VGNGLSANISRAAQLPEWPKIFAAFATCLRCIQQEKSRFFAQMLRQTQRVDCCPLLSHRGRLQSCSNQLRIDNVCEIDNKGRRRKIGNSVVAA